MTFERSVAAILAGMAVVLGFRLVVHELSDALVALTPACQSTVAVIGPDASSFAVCNAHATMDVETAGEYAIVTYTCPTEAP